jgi:hypothetical protein
LPDRVHIPVRCAKTNGGGLVTFRLLAGNSVYRFHSAQKFEPGATTDKKPPDTGAVPTELIDWRGVACPGCKGPVLRRILCGACETIGCDAGYSIREGKPWSRCACGDSGFVGTVPYEKLQTSAPTPAGNVEAGASPLALEDGTARTYPAIGRFGGY